MTVSILPFILIMSNFSPESSTTNIAELEPEQSWSRKFWPDPEPELEPEPGPQFEPELKPK